MRKEMTHEPKAELLASENATQNAERLRMLFNRQPQTKLNFSTVPTGFALSVGEALSMTVPRIALVLHPEKIILFGSYAYGAPTPDSDVDLLVIMKTNLPPSKRYLLVSRLLRPRPFPVDILVKTPSEIKHALNTGDFFVREIMSQGQVLYEYKQ